jgi:hypothetical protein
MNPIQNYFQETPGKIRARDILREFIMQGGFKPGIDAINAPIKNKIRSRSNEISSGFNKFTSQPMFLDSSNYTPTNKGRSTGWMEIS